MAPAFHNEHLLSLALAHDHHRFMRKANLSHTNIISFRRKLTSVMKMHSFMRKK
jgi:hypothetical protein